MTSQPLGFLLILVLLQAVQIFGSDPPHNHLAAHDRRALPNERRADSNIRALFQVQAGEKLAYPPVDIAGPKPRQVWMNAYYAAKKAGYIPDIPATKIVDYNPVYPSWYKKNPCSYSIDKCNRTEDINYPPAGVAVASFDDGPQPSSTKLLAFLTQNKQQATHFLISSRMISNPAQFAELDRSGQHLACHTHSHPMLTSLTDEQIVGELGWVMQIMHDMSATRKVCNFWRPPSGDLDDRVRAIARYVFGLTAVTWSKDPRDWCLSDTIPNGSACGPGNGPQSLGELQAQLKKWIGQSFTTFPGLMILHHEQSTRAIMAYEYIYPMMKQIGWKIKAVPEFTNRAWYH